ncbi:MAG: DUF362 domain-containing protein [Chitinispirillaceae bacterium]|nr:DUF362 domain-containing protein [Chitinispirillaceae bacterium]
MSITRREFVQAAAGAAVVAATAQAQDATKPVSKSEVYVGKGSAADIIPKIVGKMGGMSHFVKPGARVLIKPNMSFANPPEWGTGTTPEAVFTVAKMCLDAGAKRVIICDNTLKEPELCKEKTGIAAAVKELKGVVVFTPKQDNLFETKTNSKALELKSVDIVKEVGLCNCLISLPAAKSHSAGGVSLNIKGFMGLVKDRGAFHWKMDLHKAAADLLYYIKPNLCIVDATRALLDNGPSGPGKVVELKTFVGGIDPVAVDSYSVTLASWYGKTFEGRQIKHMKVAGDLGFGNVDSSMISEITV